MSLTGLSLDRLLASKNGLRFAEPCEGFGRVWRRSAFTPFQFYLSSPESLFILRQPMGRPARFLKLKDEKPSLESIIHRGRFIEAALYLRKCHRRTGRRDAIRCPR